MKKIKLTFLGTGTSQGVPTITCSCATCQSLDFRDKRLRTSVHIQVAGLDLVVDTGPDFRQQMIQNRVPKLDAVIFTHEHKDHTAGMDDIRGFYFKQKRDIPLYARPQVITQLRQEFSYIFAEHRYPGVPGVEVHPVSGEPFSIRDTTITPIEAMHYRLPVYGYRIGDFTYLTDANKISTEELAKMKGTRLLVLNALQFQPHISHFSVQEALEIVRYVKPERTYFTHLSHTLGKHAEVEPKLPEGVKLAYDGLTVEL